MFTVLVFREFHSEIDSEATAEKIYHVVNGFVSSRLMPQIMADKDLEWPLHISIVARSHHNFCTVFWGVQDRRVIEWNTARLVATCLTQGSGVWCSWY